MLLYKFFRQPRISCKNIFDCSIGCIQSDILILFISRFAADDMAGLCHLISLLHQHVNDAVTLWIQATRGSARTTTAVIVVIVGASSIPSKFFLLSSLLRIIALGRSCLDKLMIVGVVRGWSSATLVSIICSGVKIYRTDGFIWNACVSKTFCKWWHLWFILIQIHTYIQII